MLKIDVVPPWVLRRRTRVGESGCGAMSVGVGDAGGGADVVALGGEVGGAGIAGATAGGQ